MESHDLKCEYVESLKKKGVFYYDNKNDKRTGNFQLRFPAQQ